MSNSSLISKIPHPLLLSCPGTSQQGKILEQLDPEKIKIDDQEAEDLLNFIYQFANQVNFYDQSLQQHDWQPFFKNSLPFILARISKINIGQLRGDYDELVAFVQTDYEPQSLQLVFDFLYDEIFIPLTKWQKQFVESKSSFGDIISSAVRRNLKTALKDYIILFHRVAWFNGVNTTENYNITVRDFSELDPTNIWGLSPEDLIIQDMSAYDNTSILSGQLDYVLNTESYSLDKIVNKAIEVLKLLSKKAPHYIKESLIPKYEEQQQLHLPQLGLLYTFMELSKHFKIDINDLSTKHLDFFYKKVLNIKEQSETPDKAHLVFELQKHVNEKELKAGTLIKDGKDADNKDIFFQLDEDVVIDKAQVAHLQTLHVNYVDAVVDDGITDEEATCSEDATICPFVEGIYMAPMAKAANGVEKTESPLSWPTLGARFSKETIGDNELPERYPKAEVGFVLASPVLYLQEGKRKIDIRLCCKIEDIEGVKNFTKDNFTDLEIIFGDTEDIDGVEVLNLNETYYGLTAVVIEEIAQQLEIQVKPKIEDWLGNPNYPAWMLLVQYVLSEWWDIELTGNLIEDFYNALFDKVISGFNADLYGVDVCPISASVLSAYSVGFILDMEVTEEINNNIVVYTVTFEGNIIEEEEDVTIIQGGKPTIISREDIIKAECFIRESFKCYEELIQRIIGETAETQKVFKICLSGEKEWIVVKPEQIKKINLICPITSGNGNSGGGFECPPNELGTGIVFEGDGLGGNNLPQEEEEFACPPGTDYELCITIELDESVDSVTFFNEEALKESLGTTDPVAKILVNGDIKIPIDSCEYTPCCSLENCEEEKELTASLYHYFRHFKVLDSCIDVEVCGLKNFIVQNDENLQDVNSPIYPFGVRPEVIDFDVVNDPIYYVTQELIDAVNGLTGVPTNIIDTLEDKLNEPEIGDAEAVDEYLTVELGLTLDDSISIVVKEFLGLGENGLNLIGPSFYVGSKEIICKNWGKVWVNLSWKGKPSDFNDYYKAYKVNWSTLTPGLDEEDFEINISVLSDGSWIREDNTDLLNYRIIDRNNDNEGDVHPITQHYNRRLFSDNRFYFNNPDRDYELNNELPEILEDGYGFQPPYCIPLNEDGNVTSQMEYPDSIEQVIEIESKYFDIEHKFREINSSVKDYTTDVINGFLKITLESQDFLHKNYAFILARQMMALSYLVSNPGEFFPNAIYIDTGTGGVIDISPVINSLADVQSLSATINNNIGNIVDGLGDLEAAGGLLETLEDCLFDSPFNIQTLINEVKLSLDNGTDGVIGKLDIIEDYIDDVTECLFTGIPDNIQSYLGTVIVNLMGAADIGAAKGDVGDVLAKLGNMNNLANVNDIYNESPPGTFVGIDPDVPNAPVSNNLWGIIQGLSIDLEDVKNMLGNPSVTFDDTWSSPDPDPNMIIQKVCEIEDKMIVVNNALSSLTVEIGALLSDSQIIQEAAEDLVALVGDPPDTGTPVTPPNTPTGPQVTDVLPEGAEVPIPNEPWTPIIKEMSLDYTAKATRTDIDLIHIYPFSKTYKEEPLNPQPMLVPTLVDEGTLFIGLKDLKPGTSVNLLFQLAEATADTECDKADIKWHYLKNNRWNNELREGFEIAEDGTNGLTRSGIVKIAIPEDIPNKGYTIMPNPEPDKEPLSWLKVSARKNIAAICETVGIHTQAVVASYKNMTNRREKMLLPTGSLSRLASADSRIKKVNQFYDTYGGRVAEQSNIFYHRVSERLRHKGRGIQLFDYERLVLQHFPQVLMVRCVTHTFGLSAKKYRYDLSIAPGFVMLAVIPNLKLLASGNILEPRVSASLLDDIQTMLADKISPFTQLKVVNPRYEKVDVIVKVKFKKKITNVAFYKAKLAESLMQFLAPWTQGDNLDRLVFGRNLSASEIVEFIECRSYVDFICSLELSHEDKKQTCYNDSTEDNDAATVIAPLTARSILTVGTINVEHLSRDCEKTISTSAYKCDNVTSMKK